MTNPRVITKLICLKLINLMHILLPGTIINQSVPYCFVSNCVYFCSSVYVTISLFLCICLSQFLGASLSAYLCVFIFRYKCNTGIGRNSLIPPMDARSRKLSLMWSDVTWLVPLHLPMWRDYSLTLEWLWRTGEPCCYQRELTGSYFFVRT